MKAVVVVSGGLLTLVILGVFVAESAVNAQMNQCKTNAGPESCKESTRVMEQSTLTTACTIQKDMDFQGEDLNVAGNVETAQECSVICATSEGCKAWTYGRDTGKCYLKSSPLRKGMLKESDCCDSGTPCLNPLMPPDPLQSPEVTRRLKMQADFILIALWKMLDDMKSTIALVLFVCFFLYLGLQLVGSSWYDSVLGRIRPSSNLGPTDGVENKNVLTADDGSVLATRGAMVTLPFSYAEVLGSVPWAQVSQVKYSYTLEETGELVSICADVVEREREVISPQRPTLLTLHTYNGAQVRIEGEKAELLEPNREGETWVPIESGNLVCPLVHLEDKTRLGKAASTLHTRQCLEAAESLKGSETVAASSSSSSRSSSLSECSTAAGTEDQEVAATTASPQTIVASEMKNHLSGPFEL